MRQTVQEGKAWELPLPWEGQERTELYLGMGGEPVYGSRLSQWARGLDYTVPEVSSSLSNFMIQVCALATQLLQILFTGSLWKWKAYLTTWTSSTAELENLQQVLND